MSTNDLSAEKRADHHDRIAGPIKELDKDGHYTGFDYYQCRACGQEAMRRRDLQGCCQR